MKGDDIIINKSLKDQTFLKQFTTIVDLKKQKKKKQMNIKMFI